MRVSGNNLLVLLCGAAQVFATGLFSPILGHEIDTTAPAGRAVAAPQNLWPVQESKTPTPNVLIERGQYQKAVDELIRLLGGARGSGMEGERAALLSNLGMVYNKLGRFADAESTLEKSMQIWKGLGQAGTQQFARTSNNLANVFLNQRRYVKAEELFKQALAIYRNMPAENTASEDLAREKLTDIALALSNLGLTNISLGRLSAAEQLFLESLEIQRTSKTTKHLALTLNNLALANRLQGRIDVAARLYNEAVQAWESKPGHGRPDVAVGYHNLAMVEKSLGQSGQAEAHFKQALSIVDAALPADHPTRIAILAGYGDLLKKTGRKREGKQFESLARTMRTQHDHQNFQDLTVSIEQIAR